MNTKFKKRCIISATMGVVFGLLCFMGFSSSPDIPAEMIKWQNWSWSNPLMWLLITNRFAIGFTIGLAGFMAIHPILGFKIPAFLRGIKIGIIISLPMAFGSFMGNNPELAQQKFWITLIFGAIIGMIIDLTATKFAGEGEDLT